MAEGVKALANKAKNKIWPMYRGRSSSVPDQPAAKEQSHNLSSGVQDSIKKRMSLDSDQTDDVPEDMEAKHQMACHFSGTLEHQVAEGETLTGIAAHFEATPSLIKKINRLSMDFLYPGQVLRIPSSQLIEDDSLKQSESLKPSANKTMYEEMRSGKRDTDKDGSRLDLSSPPLSPDQAVKLDEECSQRFIKIHSKYYSCVDGIVSGTLLVTPGAVMFDPDVMDPLVMSNGSEPYGVMASMETVMSATIYTEIDSTDHTIAGMGHYVGSGCMVHSGTAPDGRLPTEFRDEAQSSDSSTRQGKEPHSAGMMAYECISENIGGDSSAMSLDGIESAQDVPLSFHTGSKGHKDTDFLSPNDPSNGKDDKVPMEGSSISCDLTNMADHVSTSYGIGTEKGGDILGTHKNGRARSFSYGQEGTAEKAALWSFSQSPTGLVGDTKHASLPTTRLRSSTTIGSIQPISTAHRPEEAVITIQPISSSPTTRTPSTKPGPITQDPDLCKYVNFGSRLFAKPSSDSLLQLYQATPPSAVHKASSSQLANVPPEHNTRGTAAFYSSCPRQFMGNSIFYTSPQYSHDNVMKISPSPLAADEKGDYVSTSGRSLFYSPLDHSEESSYGSSTSVIKQRSAPFDSLRRNRIRGQHRYKKDWEGGIQYEGAVAMSEMPALFQSVNDIVSQEEAGHEGAALYFCIKVGYPIDKKVSANCPFEAYDRNKKPAYWFSIPREKADSLYTFFYRWTPDAVDADGNETRERGFIVVEDQSGAADTTTVSASSAVVAKSAGPILSGSGPKEGTMPSEPIPITTEVFQVNHKTKLVMKLSMSWDIVSLEEVKRRRLEKELEEKRSLPLPDMDRTSAIFSESHRRKLVEVMPARVEGHSWIRLFSSEVDGFSLLRLYRSMKGVDSPVLLVVQDSKDNIFGSLTSCAFKESDHFYGTGESFLYTFLGGFKVYRWSGENEFFTKGNKDSLVVGAGEGIFGLWIDGDMYHGVSHHCETYNNEPLAGEEDFIISVVEAWAFLD